MARRQKNGLKDALKEHSIKFWIDAQDGKGKHYSIDRLLSNTEMRVLLKEIDKDQRFANSQVIVYWTTCYFAHDVWQDIMEHYPNFTDALAQLDKRMPWSYFCRHFIGKHYN